jgi:putative pyruvate formate lyase activating enzyme
MMNESPLALLRHCELCPRRCGVDRLAGEKGFCGAAGEKVKVARAALHQWEEPCISGKRGSGTVFFSYCTLRCVFCQNREIRGGEAGAEISVRRLAEIFLEQQQRGAHNLNLVTPTHYLPQILLALAEARAQGLTLPVVYNTSGYERPEVLRLLEGIVDIWLPDFKYMDERLGWQYSAAPDYPQTALSALDEMFRQTGEPVFDGDGMLQKGIVIRHLCLPGHLSDSKDAVAALFQRYGNRVWYSLMSQYTPPASPLPWDNLNHRLAARDYDALIDFAVDLGLENGFVQEEGAAEESFIPPFDLEGVLHR